MQLEDIRQLARIYKKAGGRLLITGGYTRDMIFNNYHNMGLVTKDFDVEVFGIPEDQLAEILQEEFKKVTLCGKSFGVYKVENIDIGLPRTERKVGNKHNEFKVTVDPMMTVNRASLRRDFTMNAIYYDPLSGEVIDPRDGKTDIRNKELTTCSFTTFMEDPLRILRAAQFMARFDLKLGRFTESEMRWHIHELNFLPKERVFTEIEKLLMKAPKPSVGFEMLKRIDALRVLFPSLDHLDAVTQNPKYHPEGNVWIHTMKAIDYYPPEKRDIVTMLAILFHDVGKLIELKGHAPIGAELSKTIITDRLTNDTAIVDGVYNLILHHAALLGNVTRNTIRRLAAKVDFPLLMKVFEMDRFSRSPEFVNEDVLNAFINTYYEIQHEVKPIMMGRHLQELGIAAGPIYTDILDAVFERQLDGEFNDITNGMLVLIDEVKKRNL